MKERKKRRLKKRREERSRGEGVEREDGGKEREEKHGKFVNRL